MPPHRILTLLLLILALVVAGCGSDDGGGGGGGNAPAVGSADDPATVLPPGAPVVIQASIGPDSEQGKAALTFAERVDPSDADLGDELVKSINSDGTVKYDTDIKPWLGTEAAFAFDSVADGEPTGVLAVQQTDAAAAKAFIDKAASGKTGSATYKGIEYKTQDDGQAAGVVGDFVVAASDEAHFKAAVDASEGDSVADDAQYADALKLAPADRLGAAYFDVDGFLKLLEDSGSLPQGQFDPSTIPGFQAGQSAVVSLAAENDKMTLESASTADVPEPGAGPDIADLPSGSWVAAAGPVDGDQFLTGFEQGLAATGTAEADQTLDELGVTAFLKGLESISLSLGGESIGNINGQFTIGGSDQDAASKLLKSVASYAQDAAAGQFQINVNGDTAEALVGPYKVTLDATDGDLKLSVGTPPDGKLGDDAAYKTAVDELGLDGTVNSFVDFATLEKLLKALPSDPDLVQGLAVIGELNAFALGSGERDGKMVARAVLTLR